MINVDKRGSVGFKMNRVGSESFVGMDSRIIDFNASIDEKK